MPTVLAGWGTTDDAPSRMLDDVGGRNAVPTRRGMRAVFNVSVGRSKSSKPASSSVVDGWLSRLCIRQSSRDVDLNEQWLHENRCVDECSSRATSDGTLN